MFNRDGTRTCDTVICRRIHHPVTVCVWSNDMSAGRLTASQVNASGTSDLTATLGDLR
jgi:hypothetical protein